MYYLFLTLKQKKDGSRYSFCNCSCICGKVIKISTTVLQSDHAKSCGCRRKKTGKNHPSFREDITKEQREKRGYDRGRIETKWWKAAVKNVFGNRCFLCGSTKQIEVHPIEGFKNNEELRLDVQNGVCLCREHHVQYHTQFLGGVQIPATKQSFKSFMEWWLCQLHL